MNAQAIQSTEILVRFANPAQDGKPPNIRTSDGTTYGVKPVDFGRFQPGARYRIEYVEKEGRGKWKGRTFRDIVKCDRVPTTVSASPQRSIPEGAAETSGPASELEFVTRMLAASVQTGVTANTPDALVQRGRMLREVYGKVFGT